MEFTIETPPPPDQEAEPLGPAIPGLIIAIIFAALFVPLIKPFADSLAVLVPQLIADPVNFAQNRDFGIGRFAFLVGTALALFAFMGWQVWRLVAGFAAKLRQRLPGGSAPRGLVEGVHWGTATVRMTEDGIEAERPLYSTFTRWNAFSNAALEDDILRLEAPSGYVMIVEVTDAPGGPAAALAHARHAIDKANGTGP